MANQHGHCEAKHLPRSLVTAGTQAAIYLPKEIGSSVLTWHMEQKRKRKWKIRLLRTNRTQGRHWEAGKSSSPSAILQDTQVPPGLALLLATPLRCGFSLLPTCPSCGRTMVTYAHSRCGCWHQVLVTSRDPACQVWVHLVLFSYPWAVGILPIGAFCSC